MNDSCSVLDKANYEIKDGYGDYMKLNKKGLTKDKELEKKTKFKAYFNAFNSSIAFAC